MRRPLRAAALLAAAALSLQGCGGSLAVRSSFAGPPASPPTAPGAQPGLHARGGGALAAVLVLGLVIADVIDWASQGAQADADDGRPPEARRPLFRTIDRGWVDRGP